MKKNPKKKSEVQKLMMLITKVRSKQPIKSFAKTFHELIYSIMRINRRLINLEKKMDKKMAKVTKTMKVAERDIKAGKPKEAVKALKRAEKKNVKLTKFDRDVRDPEIEAYKKMKKKGC